MGVIAIHVSMNFTKFTDLSWLPVTLATVDIYAHFAVPLFVAISGFLLAMKYDGSYSVVSFYAKRLNRILIPFLIWSVLYMLINPGIFKNPLQALFGILTGKAYYHLWFFFLIIQLYLIFPYLRKFLKHKKLWIIIAILFIQVLFRHIRKDFSGTDNFTELFKGLFLSYIFYFSFGIWVSDNIERSEKSLSKISSFINPMIFILTILISFFFSFNWLAENNGFFVELPAFMLLEKFILPFIFIMIFINLLKLSDSLKSEKFLNFMNIAAKYSFGIYLSHALFLRIAARILKYAEISWENAAFYPAAFILTLFASIGFCYLVEKTPASKPLLGIDSKRNIT